MRIEPGTSSRIGKGASDTWVHFTKETITVMRIYIFGAHIPSIKSREVYTACSSMLSSAQLECTTTTASVIAYWRLNESEMTQLHIQNLDTMISMMMNLQ